MTEDELEHEGLTPENPTYWQQAELVARTEEGKRLSLALVLGAWQGPEMFRQTLAVVQEKSELLETEVLLYSAARIASRLAAIVAEDAEMTVEDLLAGLITDVEGE